MPVDQDLLWLMIQSRCPESVPYPQQGKAYDRNKSHDRLKLDPERMRNVQLAGVLGLKDRAAEGFMDDDDRLLTRQPGSNNSDSHYHSCRSALEQCTKGQFYTQ